LVDDKAGIVKTKTTKIITKEIEARIINGLTFFFDIMVAKITKTTISKSKFEIEPVKNTK
jgi:hypothetical protein